MNQASEIVQDDIRIRELIGILWKGKVIIAAVTVFAVLVSVIASFFIISERYEARVTMNVSPITIKVSTLQGTVSIVDSLANMPVLTKANYLQQIKAAPVLEATIKKLELKDASGNYMSTDKLSSAITVSDIANTNNVDIIVNYGDPEQAALIANTIGQSFAEYVVENTNEQIQKVADSISEQLANESKNVIEKKDALNEYRSKNANIDVLNEEAKGLIEMIAEYKSNYEDLKTRLASDTASLQVLEGSSQSTDTISFSDYNISVDMNTESGTEGENQVILAPDNLSKSLLSLNINTIQTRLVTNEACLNSLETRIPELESELTQIQTTLTDEEYKYNAVNNDMTVAQLTYEAYQQRNREAVMYANSDIGKSIVTVSAEASVPGGPVSPNKKKNIIIGGALGFCLAVLFILFRNYWRRANVSSSK